MLKLYITITIGYATLSLYYYYILILLLHFYVGALFLLHHCHIEVN